MRRRFATLDVFTRHRFAGNPLAVVQDAEGLSDDAMQAIAREWVRLFDAFTDQDPGIGARLMQAMAAEPVLQATAVTTPAVRDYLLRAMNPATAPRSA